jgi:hypothetical protein
VKVQLGHHRSCFCTVTRACLSAVITGLVPVISIPWALPS